MNALKKLLSFYRDLPPELRMVFVVVGLGAPSSIIYLIIRSLKDVGGGTLGAVGIVLGGMLAIMLISFIVTRFWGMVKRRRNRSMNDDLGKTGTDGPVAMDVREMVRGNNAKFQEAVKRMKKNKVDIYSLPWYITIGDSGCGKTRLVEKSGLTFSDGVPEGIKLGTLNYNFFFSEEAVVIDMAGRLTNPRSDEDYKEWRGLLATLAKGRPGYPINAALVCISAEHLLEDATPQHEEFAETALKRLRDLQEHLGVTFATYVIVTKCDRVVGFMELFDRARRDVKTLNQMVGWSRPGDEETVYNPDEFEDDFDDLYSRLNDLRLERMHDTLEEEEGLARDICGAAYTFPEEFRELHKPLTTYVRTLFPYVKNPKAMKNLIFRGIYFTSATQEGALLTKQLRARLGEDSARLTDRLEEMFPETKPYFINDLLGKKVLPEEGLVFRNVDQVRRNRMLTKVLLFGSAALFVIVAGITYWATSGLRQYAETIPADLKKAKTAYKSDSVGPIKELIDKLDTHFGTLRGQTGFGTKLLAFLAGGSSETPIRAVQAVKAVLVERGLMERTLDTAVDNDGEQGVLKEKLSGQGDWATTEKRIELLRSYMAWWSCAAESNNGIPKGEKAIAFFKALARLKHGSATDDNVMKAIADFVRPEGDEGGDDEQRAAAAELVYAYLSNQLICDKGESYFDILKLPQDLDLPDGVQKRQFARGSVYPGFHSPDRFLNKLFQSEDDNSAPNPDAAKVEWSTYRGQFTTKAKGGLAFIVDNSLMQFAKLENKAGLAGDLDIWITLNENCGKLEAAYTAILDLEETSVSSLEQYRDLKTKFISHFKELNKIFSDYENYSSNTLSSPLSSLPDLLLGYREKHWAGPIRELKAALANGCGDGGATETPVPDSQVMTLASVAGGSSESEDNNSDDDKGSTTSSNVSPSFRASEDKELLDNLVKELNRQQNKLDLAFLKQLATMKLLTITEEQLNNFAPKKYFGDDGEQLAGYVKFKEDCPCPRFLEFKEVDGTTVIRPTRDFVVIKSYLKGMKGYFADWDPVAEREYLTPVEWDDAIYNLGGIKSHERDLDLSDKFEEDWRPTELQNLDQKLLTAAEKARGTHALKGLESQLAGISGEKLGIVALWQDDARHELIEGRVECDGVKIATIPVERIDAGRLRAENEADAENAELNENGKVANTDRRARLRGRKGKQNPVKNVQRPKNKARQNRVPKENSIPKWADSGGFGIVLKAVYGLDQLLEELNPEKDYFQNDADPKDCHDLLKSSLQRYLNTYFEAWGDAAVIDLENGLKEIVEAADWNTYKDKVNDAQFRNAKEVLETFLSAVLFEPNRLEGELSKGEGKWSIEIFPLVISTRQDTLKNNDLYELGNGNLTDNATAQSIANEIFGEWTGYAEAVDNFNMAAPGIIKWPKFSNLPGGMSGEMKEAVGTGKMLLDREIDAVLAEICTGKGLNGYPFKGEEGIADYAQLKACLKEVADKQSAFSSIDVKDELPNFYGRSEFYEQCSAWATELSEDREFKTVIKINNAGQNPVVGNQGRAHDFYVVGLGDDLWYWSVDLLASDKRQGFVNRRDGKKFNFVGGCGGTNQGPDATLQKASNGSVPGIGPCTVEPYIRPIDDDEQIKDCIPNNPLAKLRIYCEKARRCRGVNVSFDTPGIQGNRDITASFSFDVEIEELSGEEPAVCGIKIVRRR